MNDEELTYWTLVLADETGVPFEEVRQAPEALGFAVTLVREGVKEVTIPVVDLISWRAFERACAAALATLPPRRVRPSRWKEIVRELTNALRAE